MAQLTAVSAIPIQIRNYPRLSAAKYLSSVEKLMAKGENLSAEEEKLLKLLARLIEDF